MNIINESLQNTSRISQDQLIETMLLDHFGETTELSQTTLIFPDGKMLNTLITKQTRNWTSHGDIARFAMAELDNTNSSVYGLDDQSYNRLYFQCVQGHYPQFFRPDNKPTPAQQAAVASGWGKLVKMGEH
jgi:hypothetical protein